MADRLWVGPIRWAGVGLVSGLYLSRSVSTDREQIRRLFRYWQAGARIWRFADADLLLWPHERIADRDQLPGVPLRQLGPDLWCSASIPSVWRDQMMQGIWIIQGGVPYRLDLGQADLLLLSDWIDLTAYALLLPRALPVAPEVLKLPSLAGKDLRALMPNLPPPSREREQLLAGGGRFAMPRPLAGPGVLKHVGRGIVGLAAAVGVGVGGLAKVDFGFLSHSNRSGATKQGATARAGSSTARHEQVGPGWIRRWWSGFIEQFQLNRLMGPAHAAFVARMMKLFESGNLDEALRHALPLSAARALDGSRVNGLFLPKPRQSLELGSVPGIAVSLNMPFSAYARLQSLYQRAFEQFDRAGDIDRAVYVLAELLGNQVAAIDYLEKHQRFAQAAELCLRWDLAVDLQIRLLWRAGEHERAILIARRNNAFAEIIAKLEAEQSPHCEALRAEYANYLADRGDLIPAIEQAWRVPGMQEQAARWLLQAEALPDALPAEALVLRALLGDRVLRQRAEQLAEICFHPAAFEARRHLLTAVLARPTERDALKQIARWLYPAVLEDCLHGRSDVSFIQVNSLQSFLSDVLVPADLPIFKVPAAKTLHPLDSGFEPIDLRSLRASQTPVLDVARIPGKRYLIAMGESGVALVDAIGRCQKQLVVPAEEFAASGNGHLVMALIPRDDAQRITRIDVRSWQASDYGRLPIQFFNPEIQGVAFSLVSRNRILVLDAARDMHAVLWHLSDLPGEIVTASYGRRSETYGIGAGVAAERWHYDLPSRRLRAREFWPRSTADWVSLTSDNQLLEVVVRRDRTPPVIRCTLAQRPVEIDFTTFGSDDRRAELVQVEYVTHGLLVSVLGSDALHVLLVNMQIGKVLGRLLWPMDSQVRARARGEDLFLYDQHGRVAHLPMRASESACFSVQV